MFSKVFDILTRHCYSSIYLNQLGTFSFSFQGITSGSILNVVNNVKNFKAMTLIVPTFVFGVPHFLERS